MATLVINGLNFMYIAQNLTYFTIYENTWFSRKYLRYFFMKQLDENVTGESGEGGQNKIPWEKPDQNKYN